MGRSQAHCSGTGRGSPGNDRGRGRGGGRGEEDNSFPLPRPEEVEEVEEVEHDRDVQEVNAGGSIENEVQQPRGPMPRRLPDGRIVIGLDQHNR